MGRVRGFASLWSCRRSAKLLTALYERLRPCGPTVDRRAAGQTREMLIEAARSSGWLEPLEAAWPALEPVFGASPYLSSLVRRAPEMLARILSEDPAKTLRDILSAARASAKAAESEFAERRLRRLKARLHLLTALADLGGVWTLDRVTNGLTRFADIAVASALAVAAREMATSGRILGVFDRSAGPLPGLFVIAMGKHGAFELNYSSDVDLSIFFEPDALPLAPGVEPQAFAARLTDRLAAILQRRTSDGYVFRVDLRLRPDPSSTPVAVSAPAAFEYYETVGQNWERAAFIKARAVAGDIARGEDFLRELQPFIWRRHLDFAAIADIHSIKRQIHAHKVDERLTAAGADLKLGRGGIREIEFYAQTQQLILGGRFPELRAPRTVDALAALAKSGHIAPDAASQMTRSYETLRGLEHRVQMIADEQTHRLPQADADRRRVAALAGYDRLPRFDAAVGAVLRRVNQTYAELFAGEEPLSSRFGSLIFTGVEDDPETLATLERMGFADPGRTSSAIRAWHHGRIAATRTERGRELFTRLAPRLLEAAQATGAPDAAFSRFSDFFGAVSSGVQLQSLFLAQPRLLELVVRIMAFAPRFARTLARQPAALDALLDPTFFAPVEAPVDLPAALGRAEGLEAAMDMARRAGRECAFRVGVQVLGGVAGAEAAGPAFADLADALIGGLAAAALAEVERAAGPFPGEVAVIALGKCGSREMTVRSDLDLMTLYRPGRPNAQSKAKAWSAATFYTRFTQRLVAALSAPTAEGELYDVDMRLRPSGTSGPVAVSFAAFTDYYAGEAETWEFLALTRARVVWASSAKVAADAAAAVEAALRRPRQAATTARDVADMRALMAAERPPDGFWDMKLSDGGLVDIEFCGQYLQLIHAPAGGPLRQNTGEALGALGAAGLAPRPLVETLGKAWRLQQDLAQLLAVALAEGADPADEPKAFRALMIRTGGARDFRALKARIAALRRSAHAVFLALVAAAASQATPS